ncbi:hypothetical protein EJ04DRAFT_531172 [Polyplosphaeria fusca]|uniref:Zn(2)-C6 fungal-type domain-containing protein n=1 Tax=Polyplosphaeria fusca TaxID=682080 RepID=A0A9P4R8I5_9PLEO|nr:hypothetical protein EJ04DRAFT_531172 [Polyplosphaeria fusca]
MSGTPTSHAASLPGSRKIAIPRLQRLGQGIVPPRDRQRVPRACTACRNHKIKCSGDTPQCNHCETAGRECVYVLPRRDRLKIVTDRCIQMVALLKDLKDRAADDDGAKIVDLLDAVEEDMSESRPTSAPSVPDNDAAAGELDHHLAFPIINTDSLDLLEEDLLRDQSARATGFVGKNSEVQWLRSLALHLERSEDESTKLPSAERATTETRPSLGFGRIEQVASFSFYRDVDDVDFDHDIDVNELPPPDVAERLLGCYMSTVHSSFPILPRKSFELNLRKYLQAVRAGTAPRLNEKWRSILNLVFAIGAKHSHLVKASWRGDEHDHLAYQVRARALGFNGNVLASPPDLPLIQVAGLLAFYYLSTGQVSRAWVMVGMAIRFAFALGLHVRNEDPSASPAKREILSRIWWSLYALERLLNSITGRPSIIVDASCSVPLPLPFPEGLSFDHAGETSLLNPTHSGVFPSSSSSNNPSSAGYVGSVLAANDGSFLRVTVQLGLITQNIVTSLYSAGTLIRSLGDIQHDIVQYSQRLDSWLGALPSEFRFHNQQVDVSSSRPHVRERLCLCLQHCSARIMLTRPCLGGFGQSAKDASVPKAFMTQMADICVEAATTMADLLPDQPDPSFVYENGPWWSIVHHLMQAVSVILIALTTSVNSQGAIELVGCAKKMIWWLGSMQDPQAERACYIALGTLEAVADRLHVDTSGDMFLMVSGHLIRFGQRGMAGAYTTVELQNSISSHFFSNGEPGGKEQSNVKQEGMCRSIATTLVRYDVHLFQT